MGKILFISYYYGEGYAAGIQNKRLTDALTSHGIDSKVICRFCKISDNDNIYKINFPNWKKLNFLQYKLFPGLNGIITIDQIFWLLKVLFFLRKRFKEFEYIHIASSPFLIQLLGYYIKKRSKCKWVVQLLDPISDNNYMNTYKYGMKILKKIEKMTVKNADLILFNNNRLLKKFQERYCDYQSKFKTLLHVTDKNIITSDLRNKKVTLYHTGSLSALRKIDFLVKSLLKLRGISDKITELEIHFVGDCSIQDKNMVKQHKLENIILFSDYVTFNEMIALLSRADALIIIDSIGSEGVFAASKLCEYFSFQKPILAITPKEGVTSDILKSTGHLCFDVGDEELLANELAKMLFNRKWLDDKFNKSIFENYLPENIAKNYLQLIK